MILKQVLSQSSSTTLGVMAAVDEQLLFNPFCLPCLQWKTTEETTSHDMFFSYHLWQRVLPLVVQKSSVHQLRLEVYLPLFPRFYISQVVIAGSDFDVTL